MPSAAVSSAPTPSSRKETTTGVNVGSNGRKRFALIDSGLTFAVPSKPTSARRTSAPSGKLSPPPARTSQVLLLKKALVRTASGAVSVADSVTSRVHVPDIGLVMVARYEAPGFVVVESIGKKPLSKLLVGGS